FDPQAETLRPMVRDVEDDEGLPARQLDPEFANFNVPIAAGDTELIDREFDRATRYARFLATAHRG
ncbi:MAG: hypothetical protein RLZZ621_9, partial [Gemmatimonadota bacterium]